MRCLEGKSAGIIGDSALSLLLCRDHAAHDNPRTPRVIAMPISTSPEFLPVSSLLPGESPRLAGLDDEHVKTLAEIESCLPPVIVHRATLRVIDGMHRLRAAQLKGHSTIPVLFFDGSEESAFILAVSENIAHGLPLRLTDRIAAAERILLANPRLSNQIVATKAGLAAGTVAGIRDRLIDGDDHPGFRIGRDGRARPYNSAAARSLASSLIDEKPNASLRAIAREAGISAATVLDVRNRKERGDDPVPEQQAKGKGAGRQGHRVGQKAKSRPEPAAILEKMRKDPSLKYSDAGRAFLAWLGTQMAAIKRWETFLDKIPRHFTEPLIDLACECAESWYSFAEELERMKVADSTPLDGQLP
jgi:hypothetical protein